MIEFGVLGPLTVHRDHRPVSLNAAMLRGLLALLLHRPGQPVATSSIVDTLWPDRPPATARKTIQVYVGRLRRALGDEQRIRHGPGGYTIVVAADELDVARFRALIGAGRVARRRGELAQADSLLTEALALWRGTPFADLDGADVIADQIRLLEEHWLAAGGALAGRPRDAGRGPAGPAPPPRGGRRPHRPTVRPPLPGTAGLLPDARAVPQRPAERGADPYRHTRTQLAEELGIEPGPTMSWLQQAILRTDSRLWQISATDLDGLTGSPMAPAQSPHPPSPATPPTPAATRPVPAQLPPDVSGFTGREDALKALDVLDHCSSSQ